MRTRWRRTLALPLLLGLLTGIATAGAEEVARAQNITGRVTLNKSKRVGPNTEFKEGDVVDVSSSARLTVAFEDAAYLELLGPTRLEFVQISDQGRRVKLLSGVISEAFVRGIALEIQTDYEAGLVLQNSTATARVAPGDRVTFQRRDGAYLKVFDGTKASDLETTWTKSLRREEKVEPEEAKGDVKSITLGSRVITFRPASKFTEEQLEGGGVRLTFNGPDFGRVMVGTDTVLFLATGEFIEFDSAGYVQRLSRGVVVHINHPITEDSFYDQPVENAANASVRDPRAR